jgi:uncharacterized integral membrane protein
MSKNELKLKQLEKEEKEANQQKWTAIILAGLVLIAIIATWVEQNQDAIRSFFQWVCIGVAILVVYLFFIGLNPLSKLSWKMYYQRVMRYKIQQLLERAGLPVDTPDEELPEHTRDTKVLIEGEYRSKIEKMNDRKFLY